jgi:hypothetical protein
MTRLLVSVCSADLALCLFIDDLHFDLRSELGGLTTEHFAPHPE